MSKKQDTVDEVASTQSKEPRSVNVLNIRNNHTVTQIAAELADREAIRDCLLRYSRACDRLDTELLNYVYWPDAIDEHAGFTGNREEFINYINAAIGSMEITQHFLGNMLIVIDGNDANTETYYQAYHRIRGENGVPFDVVGGGRYIDHFEKRNDEWRISERFVTTDWLRVYPDSIDWDNPPLGIVPVPGGHKPDDPSYKLMGRRRSS